MSSKILKYLILLAIALFIISISSFWFGGSSFREKDVSLELEGPTQISVGDEVVYKLKYSNGTRTNLSNLDFTFYYPEGSTVIVDGLVMEDHVENFTVDNLAPGQNGEKEFSAFLLGERGNIKTAKMSVSFKAGTIKSSFEKTATFSTTIISSDLSLDLVAPPSIVSGQIAEYIIDYRNNSDADMSDLIFELDYPEGFYPTEFSPSSQRGNNIWEVASIKKRSGGRISIKGELRGSEGENKVVSAKLRRKIGGNYVDYQRASTATVISNPIFELGILINGTSDYSASLGDRLSYTIKYKNNSNFNLSRVNLTVKFEGDMFDFSNLDTRGGFFDDSSKTITWNSSTVSDFVLLSPRSQGQIIFNVPVKSSFSGSVPGSSKDKFAKISVKIGTPNVPTGIDTQEVSTSTSLVTKIGTQPTFNQTAYYSDSDFGSSGPLPLKVGEETVFTVHWQLTNPGNDAKDIKVRAKLPSGVFWTNSVKSKEGQPQPEFNPNTFEVVWELGQLPFGAGTSGDKYEASFQIKVKPSSNQKGSTIPLLENIQFSGKDSFTGQDIVINKANLNSNDITDRPKEGTVQ